MTGRGGRAGADDLLSARLDDLARRAARAEGTEFSRFLDPAQAEQAARAARGQGVSVAFWGGYADAERRIAGFSAGEAGGIPPGGGGWPVRWLRCRWDARYAAPRHADLLGALLGQGIGREGLGDIVLLEGHACCAALPDIAGYLSGSLREAGRAKLACDVLEAPPPLPEPRGEFRRATVASLRLDALLSAAWRFSRGEALELIRQGKARVDYLPEERPGARVAKGALISVRGKGRVRLAEIGEPTRKGRVAVTLFHYQ